MVESRIEFSGHTKKNEVANSSLKTYRAIEEAEQRGERPIYRPKNWKNEAQAQKRVRKKVSWYKCDSCELVIIVPATTGSRLVREYQREVRSPGFKVRVVEEAVVNLQRMLQISNPLKERPCSRTYCSECTMDVKGPCDRHGVTCEIVCNEYGKVYARES